eukprot:TRINITY_DN1590_c0_g1_i1.p1 TRINITY_DN1590_c0_g1~~TRINITY_DN1590_c0_g1_i1.p1  ORF type:complete len:663 (+),score=129.55 TRINITY_DN1590_c0_g1_i1:42-1991(+)
MARASISNRLVLLLSVMLLVVVAASLVETVDARCIPLLTCSLLHGSCKDSKCVCDNNYEGKDCTIFNQEIKENEQVSGTVGMFSWNYYYFTNENPFSVTLKSDQGKGIAQDCDWYVQKGDYPSNNQFDYKRSVKEKASDWELTNLPEGTWYIGVYGRLLYCSYNLEITFESQCPSDCNGYGTCNDDGTCTCDVGHFGHSCGHFPIQLTPGTTTQGTVKTSAFDYYFIDVEEDAALLTVTVAEDRSESDNGDVDIFLRKAQLPTLFKWDVINASQTDVSTVVVPQPAVARYYIGVYGFIGSDFSITADISTSTGTCTDRCSDHGSCAHSSDASCECDDDWDNTLCGEFTGQIEVGHQYTGFVDRYNWNYFPINIDSTNTFTVTVDETTPAGDASDCDLYLRTGKKPSQAKFDQVDIFFARTYSLNFVPGVDGSTVWAGIYGFQGCEYQISVTEDACACVGDTPHGTCKKGQCECDAGWGGVGCDVQSTTLGQDVLSSVVHVGDKDYYTLSSTATLVTIVVKENGNGGTLRVFASAGNWPTDVDYDWSEDIQRPSTVDSDWSVDVHPSDMDDEGDSLDGGMVDPYYASEQSGSGSSDSDVHDHIHILTIDPSRLEVGTDVYIGVFAGAFVAENSGSETKYTITSFETPFKK